MTTKMLAPAFGAFLVLLTGVGDAKADGMQQRRTAQAPGCISGPFAGPYIGVNAGYGRVNTTQSSTPDPSATGDDSAFTVGGQVPFHLTTQEFMHEVRSLLKPDGVFLVNINSAVEGPNSRILRAEYKTALTVFDAVLIFPRPFDTERGKPKIALSRGRNVILIGLAGRNDWTLDSVAGTARSLMKEEKARTPTFLDDALQLYTGRPRTDDVPLLTDDYAPVDTMVF